MIWPWKPKAEPEKQDKGVFTFSEIPGQTPEQPGLDPNSPTWQFVKAHLRERLNELREQNDSGRKTERDTQFIRGRIAEVKDMLELDRPKPQQRVSDEV